jgi:hypothetical protein
MMFSILVLTNIEQKKKLLYLYFYYMHSLLVIHLSEVILNLDVTIFLDIITYLKNN